jgi:hypothetical protein
MPSVLHERVAEFRDRDAFLYALLGLVAYGRRLERALESLGKAPRAFTPGPDRRLDVALGVISVMRRCTRHLTRWGASAREAPSVRRPVLRALASGELWR